MSVTRRQSPAPPPVRSFSARDYSSLAVSPPLAPVNTSRERPSTVSVSPPFAPVKKQNTPVEHSEVPDAMEWYEIAMGSTTLPSVTSPVEKFATVRLTDPEMSFQEVAREWWQFRRHEDEFVRGKFERVPAKHLLSDPSTPYEEVRRRWQVYIDDCEQRENRGVPEEKFWLENRG